MIWSNFRWGLSEVGRSVLSTTSDGMATLSWQRLWCDELDSLSYPTVKSEIGNFPRCFNWCSFQSSKPTFGPSRWHVRPANQDTTRQTKLPCCCSTVTVFLFVCSRYLSVEDNSELGWKPISSVKIYFKSELTYFFTYPERFSIKK